MPKVKREDSSDSDDAEPLAQAKGKRGSTSTSAPDAKKARTQLPVEHNDEGEPFITLEKTRRVTARKFKGKTYIDLREFYTDKGSGDLKPGKKGISLSVEQWEMLKANVEVIEEMLSDVK